MHALLVYGSLNARQTLRCALPVARHFINPLPWEKSAGTWSIFKLFIQARFPWLRRSGRFPRLFSSKASLLVFRSAQLVLKTLTLNFTHQLEAMPLLGQVVTYPRSWMSLLVLALFSYFSLLFLDLNSKKNLRESLWRKKIVLFLGGDWFFFMFSYYNSFEKGNNTHSLKITLASV